MPTEERKARVPFEDFTRNGFLPWVKQNRRMAYYTRNVVALNKLGPFFKDKALSDISPFDIERYKSERLKTVKPATLCNELACLKRLYTLAIRWAKATINPVKSVDFPHLDNRIDRILSNEEEVRLLSHCKDHLHPIVVMALDTGMRTSEILNLRWSQVKFEGRLILVESYKVFPVPMSNRLLNLLRELNKLPSDEYVFCGKVTGKPFGSIKTAFKTALKKAGITGFRFHDFRHTFASRLRARGVDLVTIKELLGHATIKTTMRYAHTNLEAKRKAISALDGHYTDTSMERGANLANSESEIRLVSTKILTKQGPVAQLDRATDF